VSKSYLALILLSCLGLLNIQAEEMDVIQECEGKACTQIGINKGTINITGYTITQHQNILEKEKKQLRKDLETLHKSRTENLQYKMELLELKLAEVNRRLANPAESYQKRIAFLESTIRELRTFKGDVNDNLLAKAETALQQGDTTLADDLFAQIEEQEKMSIERAAKAAFERGKIAVDNIDYRKALKHYTRAVELAPNNGYYLSYAGSMAGTMGKHDQEVRWKTRSLDLYLKSGGEDSSNVAGLRNNLGSAYYSLGQNDKAIEYYQLALASDLKTYGEDHSKVAIRRNNLGSAYDSLGQYDKAIEYYQLALSSFERVLGEDHPYTKTVASSLRSVPQQPE
jgi:tetratricopeptide (TPR) repeat protein